MGVLLGLGMGRGWGVLVGEEAGLLVGRPLQHAKGKRHRQRQEPEEEMGCRAVRGTPLYPEPVTGVQTCYQRRSERKG